MTKANEEAMLAEARTEVSYADHKASMVLAALGIGFGAVLGGLLAGDWKPSNQGGGEWAWWLGATLAVGAITASAAAVWPRWRLGQQEEGVYYWGQVARLKSYDEMCERLNEKEEHAGDRTRHQLWELSRIVATKYRFLRGSFVLAGLSAIAFGLSAWLA